MTEQYSYNAPGEVMSKQFQVSRLEWISGSQYTVNASLAVDYSYNTAGQVSAISYPVTMIDPNWYWSGSPNGSLTYTLTYGFDNMGRPNSPTGNFETSNSAVTSWVRNVAYDYAGRLSSMQYLTGLSDNATAQWRTPIRPGR